MDSEQGCMTVCIISRQYQKTALHVGICINMNIIKDTAVCKAQNVYARIMNGLGQAV